MGELLAGLPVGGISAATLLGIVVLLVLTGRLVPRQQVLDVREDRDTWRKSSEKWQQVSTQHGMTLERLIDYAEAADHALTQIQAVVQTRGEEPR